jgi:hypothetical protein
VRKERACSYTTSLKSGDTLYGLRSPLSQKHTTCLFKKIPSILSKLIDPKIVEGRDKQGRPIGEFESIDTAILLQSVLRHNNIRELPIGKKLKASSIVSSGRETHKFITTLWKEEGGTIFFYSERVTKHNKR